MSFLSTPIPGRMQGNRDRFRSVHDSEGLRIAGPALRTRRFEQANTHPIDLENIHAD